MHYKQVEFRFSNIDTGEYYTLLTDPKGWDASERTIKRSDKNFSIFTELSKNLVFTKDARKKLIEYYGQKYIEAKVKLEEWRNHPHTSALEMYSVGDLDFSQIEITDNEVQIPFTTGGLNSLIKSHLSDKFELNRTESLTGSILPELKTEIVNGVGREIFLLSELKEDKTFVKIFSDSQFSQNKTHREPVPLEVISQSDEENISFTYNSPEGFESYSGNAEASETFYTISDIDKKVTIHIDVSFTISDVNFSGDVDNKDFYLRLRRYNNGDLMDFVEIISTLVSVTDNVVTHKGESFSVSSIIDVDILTGESLALEFEMYGEYGLGGFMQVDLNNIKANISVAEDSFTESTTFKTILIHDVFERLTHILTGEANRFYSDFFGRTDIGYTVTGEYALAGLSPGFWIRNFDDKPIEVSLKLLDDCNAVYNTGYGVEIMDGVERLVVEDQKHFFRPRITIKLGRVNNLKRVPADDLLHSTLEFGYKKPDGDNLYEEAMGLDEYNTRSKWVNNLTRTDKDYEKIADIRTDSYGKAFATRKRKLNFPQEDTRYDNDNFLLDLKTGIGPNYEERLWQDDYEVQPTGVYSPDTATNLRLTPYRNFERHQWLVKSILTKFPNEKVRYASGIGNKELTTKKVGEDAREENTTILVSDMKPQRFKGEYVTFEHPVDNELNYVLKDYFYEGERKIPNTYGLVEFINEKGKKEYGYLFEVKPNGKGSWKLLV